MNEELRHKQKGNSGRGNALVSKKKNGFRADYKCPFTAEEKGRKGMIYEQRGISTDIEK